MVMQFGLYKAFLVSAYKSPVLGSGSHSLIMAETGPTMDKMPEYTERLWGGLLSSSYS